MVVCGGTLYGVYILGPTYDFRVDSPADRITILAFIVVGVIFSYFGDMVRQKPVTARIMTGCTRSRLVLTGWR